MKFANTLMSGVGQGFQQFFHNLPAHLGQSLFQWLFSKMADVGIQMPVDFSIPSILTLVLQVMGISWTRIKAILTKHIGEKNAEVLDQAYQLINTLIQRGPLGVYHLVQEHLDPGMIIDAIKNAAISYVMEAIITRVAARIIMMLNPAGAILQAIEAIYRVIKWVIDNAARIFTLIEAVVNGVAQILAGNVSGVANLVERALGLLLVPVIDFLADYLGLCGIPEALKKVIMGLQSRVEQISEKTYMGAKKTGPSTFEGKFGHKDWSWAGYPPVNPVMLHPANPFLGYHNDAAVIKPTGQYKISSGTDSAPEPVEWRAALDDRKNTIKAGMLAKGMSDGDAENNAKKQVESEYAQQGYAYNWMDLNCYKVGTHQFQGHHILPANWSDPTNDSPSNFQYLAQAQHSRFTTWWEARKKEINDKLNAPD